MIALLSPAKNMSFAGNGENKEGSLPIFLDDSAYLMNKLKKLSARQIGKMMKINAELADLNVKRNQHWNEDYEDNEAGTAINVFAGEVYRGLNADGFDQDDLSYANEHLAILSGLYGLLKPLDVIQPYRLEMGLSWKITPKIKNLYTYWGDKISLGLNQFLADHDEKVLVNLASNEYWKSVQPKSLEPEVVTCQFLDWKNGEYKAVMTWAKLARGAMAREIVINRVDRKEGLKEIAFNGYVYNDQLSDPGNFVFTREGQV